MITYEQAMAAQNFEHATLKNSDGSPVRARRNGATKTWKREPGRFRIPVKHGLKYCFYIELHNAAEWNAV